MTSAAGRGRPVSRRQAIAMLGLLAGVVSTGSLAACSTLDPDDRGDPLWADPEVASTAEERISIAPRAEPRPAMPDRVVSMWMYDWRHPTIGALPDDVLDTLSMLVVAMAQSGKSGSGQLRFAPSLISTQELATQINDVVRRGRPVLIGIGGQNDGGITVTNQVEVDEFCDSIREIVQEFGFTGIDLDLEPSGSTWTQDALAAVVRQLKSEFGPDFIVGITAALYGAETGRWLALAGELGDSYDFFAHMLYDYVEATDARLEQDAIRKVGIAADGGVPTAKQVLGFMCNTSTYSSPVDLTGSTWAKTLARFPDLLGAFIWESSIEESVDYEWTRSVGATVSDR